MKTELPDDIRGDVQRMREILCRVVQRSHLSPAQIEQGLHVRKGFLDHLFAGRSELQVAHVYRILRLTGVDPWRFFLTLFELNVQAADQPADHVTAAR
ncbi:MAG TPA: hypothetical protein VKM72_26090 [Thermoanaerobaculia bacterium]|nr:hypothetical protein [Thermoanaerobaculia bacterium]